MPKLSLAWTCVAGSAILLAMATSAAAQSRDDPEMNCVSALAEKMAVSMDQISSMGEKRVGEGTQVTLKAGDTADRWLCYVYDDGEVTSFEEKPATAKRRRR